MRAPERSRVLKFFRFLQNSEEAFFFFFAPLVGICTGLAAVIFIVLIRNFHALFFVGGKQALHFLGEAYVIVIPCLGGLITGPIIFFLAKEAKGHGVPEVMDAIITAGGKIRGRVAAVKAIASSICIGSGGSVGREGPFIQIGSSLGSSLGQIFKLPEEKIKILVACGAAGGVAATFNAPLAGIFFALEVILGEYGPRNLSSVVLSSVSATVVSRHFLGATPAFKTPIYRLLGVREVPLYLLLGLAAALVAVLYTKTLYFCEDIFDSWKFPEMFKPAVGGLLLGFLGFYAPQIFGIGYDQIELALQGKIALWIALCLVLFKILATSFTLGSGGSGGVFAPALFTGAMFGEAFGKLASQIVPSMAMQPGASALVGMASVFAGAAHAPITAILILFEMTGDYKIILPLMLTCITSTVVVRRMMKDSIYTLKLKRRGIDLEKRRGIDLIESIKVRDAMFKKVITVDEKATVREAGLMIKTTSHRGFPVVNRRDQLLGIVTRQDINQALEKNMADHPVTEIMTRKVMTCYPNESLREALEKMGRYNIGRLPVVEIKAPDHLIGIVTRKGIISAFNEAIQEKEEKGAGGAGSFR